MASKGLRRALEWARLWLSYQRYAIALVGVPLAGALVVAWMWPSAWWIWGGLTLASVPSTRWALEIGRRWPRKVRATWLADRRIAAGRFRPVMVRRWCGDPCSRVVAREILRRAGVAGVAGRRQVAAYGRLEAARTRALVLGNAAVTYVVDGDGVQRFDRGGEGSR